MALETGYKEACCFNNVQDQCPGVDLCTIGCRCHDDTPVPLVTDARIAPPTCIALPASVYDEDAAAGATVQPHALALVFHGMRHGSGQTEALLSKSGLIGMDVMYHHPFLVFDVSMVKRTARVRVERHISDVLRYADDTALMLQWPGRYRSDWFVFTVGDLRSFLVRLAAEKDDAAHG